MTCDKNWQEQPLDVNVENGIVDEVKKLCYEYLGSKITTDGWGWRDLKERSH